MQPAIVLRPHPFALRPACPECIEGVRASLSKHESAWAQAYRYVQKAGLVNLPVAWSA